MISVHLQKCSLSKTDGQLTTHMKQCGSQKHWKPMQCLVQWCHRCHATKVHLALTLQWGNIFTGRAHARQLETSVVNMTHVKELSMGPLIKCGKLQAKEAEMMPWQVFHADLTDTGPYQLASSSQWDDVDQLLSFLLWAITSVIDPVTQG